MQLQKTFSYIISSNILKDVSLDIGEVIAKKGLTSSRKDCLDILNIYGIKNLEDFKDKSIKLTLFYIVAALKDNLVSDEEIKNIRFLKLLFNIEEGDFVKEEYFANEVSKIIKTQIYLMHQDDDRIDTQEALHKVNLQEIFGLSYDQFLVLNNQEALDAIDRGSDWLEMDTYITVNEYSQWVKKNNPSEDIETETRSRHISEEVKDSVWNRDGGECVQCGNNENLEFDHIIPFSEGGANTKRNIQLLCQTCNRSKSNKIG